MTGKKTFIGLFLALALPAMALATEYSIDVMHSGVGFKVRHMGISKVPGSFGDFEGSFAFDPDAPEKGWAKAIMRTASVDTGSENRDKHLRSEDFFDSEKFPEMIFESTLLRKNADGDWQLQGQLTLKGITREIVLDLELLGELVDRSGQKRVGFTATGRINRQHYGLGFNKILETGGLLVGDKVDIILEIQGIEK